MKDITIITVSTNRLDQDCLTSVESVIKQTPLKTAFVVVDNASTAYSAYGYVKNFAPSAQVILRQKNQGFGQGCNLGAKEIPAKYYFFLNPDTKFHQPQILKTLFDFMENNQFVGIAAPQLFNMNGQIQESCWRWPRWYQPLVQRTNLLPAKITAAYSQYFVIKDLPRDRIAPVDWAQGSALFIRGDLFDELGGFDERFFVYYEDTDICRRSWNKNHPVYYQPQAQLQHVYSKTSAGHQKDLVTNIKQVLQNRMARIHLLSWLKYHLKWLA